MGQRLEERPAQAMLNKEDVPVVYFTEGTMVWPDRGRRGVVAKGHTLYTQAREAPVNGLSGFIATENCTLYLDGRYSTLAAGRPFGTQKRNSRPLPRSK